VSDDPSSIGPASIGPASIDHVTVSAAPEEFAAALACYDAALSALGLARLSELVDEEEDDASVEAVGWGAPTAEFPVFWLVSGATSSSGLHVRLKAHSRSQVEAFHATAVQAGATSHAAPRRWTPYRRGEFGATIRDPAGNLLEAVAPE
jgi:catechol 2,3-dioxygenase-like lactoylglutathione lyase family enzyme